MQAEKPQNTACAIVGLMRLMPNDSANTNPSGEIMAIQASMVG